MKNEFLRAFKKVLTEKTTEAYFMRKDEVELEGYSAHFADMGMLISGIDAQQSVSALVLYIENRRLESAGMFVTDPDFFEELFKDVLTEVGYEFRQ